MLMMLTHVGRSAVLCAGSLLLLLLLSCRKEEPLPKLFVVPDAHLVSDAGKPFQLSLLRGHVAVYDFIFTNCAGTCPMMTGSMKRLATSMSKERDLRFVSISVDPERDTPEVLRAWADRTGRDSRWVFLTGERDAIISLSRDGFKLAAGDSPGDSASGQFEPILHSTKFVLVDRDSSVRGYYDALSEESVKTLERDMRRLLREE